MAFKVNWQFLSLIFCLTLVYAQISDSEENGSSETAIPLVFDYKKFIQPKHYDVHLIISSTEKFRLYDGIVKITFESKTNSKLFRFISAESINITSVKLVNLRNFVEASDFALKREKKFYTITDDAFVVSNNGNIIEQSEVYELEVRFNTAMNQYHDNRAFFASKYNVGNETSYFAATHFQTKYIRDAIPTFEDVSFKVPIKLRITHHPKFIALSNMPGRIVSGDDNRVTTEFNETPPMPGYILAFAIGEFKSKPVPNARNISFHIYGSSKIYTETDDATAISGQILLGMENYFDIQYALPKMDYLIIPEFPFYGMENWGLVVFIESKIFGSWKTTKTSDLIVNTYVNAHELAHQYFGNLVTPKEWRYVWLSEGFATFFSYYILNQVFPNDHYNDQFFIDNLFSTYDLDDYGSTLNPRAGKSSIYDVAEKVNYYKASSLIRMIMHVVGENKFREAIQMYLKQHEYNSTVPMDLIIALHNVVKQDASWPVDIKVESFIESWTHQSGTPILTVKRNYVNGDVELKQKYNNKGDKYDEGQKTWWIPYNYASRRNPNFEDTTPVGWMENETMVVINLNLSPHDWLIFNKQYTGLYIVNYDERNWDLLINELIHGNHELFHEYNRAQMIHDLNRLVEYKQIEEKYLIKLLFYLKREKSHLPWSAANTVLENLWVKLGKTKYGDILKMAIKYMTSDSYDHYRLNAQQQEPKSSLLTRTILVKWACLSGYQNCIQDFDRLSEEYLNSLLSQQPLFVHPDLMDDLFCYGFQNESSYNRMFEFFVTNPDHPASKTFFSQFQCKWNTKLYRIYYHATHYAIEVKDKSEYPAYDKIPSVVRNFRGDKISVVYQCLLENCFDFRYNAPNDYVQDLALLIAGTIDQRYIIPSDLLRIKRLLTKVQEVYGNATIEKIGKYVKFRDVYWF